METSTLITLSPAELKEVIQTAIRDELSREQQRDEARDWPPFLSRQQLAKRLNISPQTVTAWERRGILKGQKTGRIIRYSRESVLSALKKMKK